MVVMEGARISHPQLVGLKLIQEQKKRHEEERKRLEALAREQNDDSS